MKIEEIISKAVSNGWEGGKWRIKGKHLIFDTGHRYFLPQLLTSKPFLKAIYGHKIVNKEEISWSEPPLYRDSEERKKLLKMSFEEQVNYLSEFIKTPKNFYDYPKKERLKIIKKATEDLMEKQDQLKKKVGE